MTAVPVVRWTLTGRINDQDVAITGGGHAQPAEGMVSLDLRSDRELPAGFDMFAAQMICNVAMSAFAAAGDDDDQSLMTLSPRGIRVAPRRIGRVFDEAGSELMAVSAVTTLTYDEQGIVVDNMVDGFAHLPQVLAITDAEEHLVPTRGTNRAMGLAQFKLSTPDGSLLGATASPYVLDGTAELVSAMHREIELERSSVNDRNALAVIAKSAWSPAFAHRA